MQSHDTRTYETRQWLSKGAIFFAVMLPHATLAQDAPTLGDAISFIKAKTEICQEYIWAFSLPHDVHTTIHAETFASWKSSTKTLQWTFNFTRIRLGDEKGSSFENYYLPLSELNPSVKVDGARIFIECRKGRCIKLEKHGEVGEVTKDDAAKVEFKVCNGDTASRLGKALSHAIKLSGGIADKF